MLVALVVALRLVNSLVSLLLVAPAGVVVDLAPGVLVPRCMPTQPAERLRSQRCEAKRMQQHPGTVPSWQATESRNPPLALALLHTSGMGPWRWCVPSLMAPHTQLSVCSGLCSPAGAQQLTVTALHPRACLQKVLPTTGYACVTQRGLHPTCRHLQTTRLQPPFFSTGLPHLGQGLVLAASQLLVSLSSWIFRFHFFHLHACSHA